MATVQPLNSPVSLADDIGNLLPLLQTLPEAADTPVWLEMVCGQIQQLAAAAEASDAVDILDALVELSAVLDAVEAQGEGMSLTQYLSVQECCAPLDDWLREHAAPVPAVEPPTFAVPSATLPPDPLPEEASAAERLPPMHPEGFLVADEVLAENAPAWQRRYAALLDEAVDGPDFAAIEALLTEIERVRPLPEDRLPWWVAVGVVQALATRVKNYQPERHMPLLRRLLPAIAEPAMDPLAADPTLVVDLLAELHGVFRSTERIREIHRLFDLPAGLRAQQPASGSPAEPVAQVPAVAHPPVQIRPLSPTAVDAHLITQAMETWPAAAQGDAEARRRFVRLAQELRLVVEQEQPRLMPLMTAMVQVVDRVNAPTAEQALEVAATLLLVRRCLLDRDMPPEPVLENRLRRLQQPPRSAPANVAWPDPRLHEVLLAEVVRDLREAAAASSTEGLQDRLQQAASVLRFAGREDLAQRVAADSGLAEVLAALGSPLAEPASAVSPAEAAAAAERPGAGAAGAAPAAQPSDTHSTLSALGRHLRQLQLQLAALGQMPRGPLAEPADATVPDFDNALRLARATLNHCLALQQTLATAWSGHETE